MTPEEGITCVVVDDHPAVLEAVSRYLEENGIHVVARARDGAEGLTAIVTERPRVAIVDVAMARMGGLELARSISRLAPETAVIVYSGLGRRDNVLEALDAGARGFVVKDAALSELVRAIQTVVGGGTYIDATLATVLAPGADPVPLLTQREREVLRLLSQGMSNEEIGGKIFISPETVRTHVRKSIAKLGARNRTEAVALALRHSLIS